MKDKLKLFLTGFLQVVLVAVNTWQISHCKYAGAFVVGFGISLFWSYNVKKIAFGTLSDRLLYASGAAVGSLTGLLISQIIYK
jgi:hypothetical protein